MYVRAFRADHVETVENFFLDKSDHCSVRSQWLPVVTEEGAGKNEVASVQDAIASSRHDREATHMKSYQCGCQT